MATPLDPMSVGFFIGLLAGEGHFGGDGRQPQITLRMHVRHEGTFRWLQERFPGGALYGPYSHGGRDYYQWMVRGTYLRRMVAPLIHRHRALLDEHVLTRFGAMCERYALDLDAPLLLSDRDHELRREGPADGEVEQDGGVVGGVSQDRRRDPAVLADGAEE